MLLQRKVIPMLWMIIISFVHGESPIDYEECQNETGALIANAQGLAESYPSNASCTFLSETYCAVDLSDVTQEYIQRCYEASGRIVLATSTAQCNSTLSNVTVFYVSIVNDPQCFWSNCSLDRSYNAIDRYIDLKTLDRYDALFNHSVTNGYCNQFDISTVWKTVLTGMCAVDTLQLQASLPELIVPYEKCKSNNCTKNYTDAAEVYNRMCRGKGGDPYRQSRRTASCTDEAGAETTMADVNIPSCFSEQCTPEAIDEEQLMVAREWRIPISRDYSSCSFEFSNVEAVNASSSSNDGKNDTSSGGRRVFVNELWQWATVLLFMMALPLGTFV
jgi:hypothetical protein